MKTFLIATLILIAVLLLIFGVNLLLTHGIIWVAKELFHIDWSGHFWAVFVLLIIAQATFRSTTTVRK